MYHISDIKTYLRCPKLFKDTYNQSNEKYNPFLRVDDQITGLAIKKLKINDYYLGIKNDLHKNTMEMLKQHEWVVKGRFEYHGLRVKIPFIHKIHNNQYVLYFTQLHNFPTANDIIYYYLNYYVLIKNGLDIVDIKIIHLNSQYVRGDELDVDGLYIISDYFYNNNGHQTKLVYDTVVNYDFNVENTIRKMNDVLRLDDIKGVKTIKCYRKTKCLNYDVCFDNEIDCDDSILTLVSSQNKNQMYQNGIRHLKDADLSLTEGSRVQYAQIMASKNGGLFVDKYALKNFLDQLKGKTLAFVDFEWDTFAIPPYKNMKTFDVMCFQYSLDIQDLDGKITHKDFIGFNDTRIDFIEHLIQDIPEDALVIAFNARGAERIRLLELERQYPQYQKPLESIINRFVDLSDPFSLGLVYDTRMKGNFSLKVIANMIDPSINYNKIEIHMGMDAVYSWRDLDKHHEISDEVKNNLLEYCNQDSYSMIVILNWLRGLYENI